MSRFHTVFAPAVYPAPLLIEDLNAVIRLVGDVNEIVGAKRDATRIRELPRFPATTAPTVAKATVLIVDRQAIGFLDNVFLPDAEVADIDRAVVIDCDTARLWWGGIDS